MPTSSLHLLRLFVCAIRLLSFSTVTVGCRFFLLLRIWHIQQVPLPPDILVLLIAIPSLNDRNRAVPLQLCLAVLIYSNHEQLTPQQSWAGDPDALGHGPGFLFIVAVFHSTGLGSSSKQWVSSNVPAVLSLFGTRSLSNEYMSLVKASWEKTVKQRQTLSRRTGERWKNCLCKHNHTCSPSSISTLRSRLRTATVPSSCRWHRWQDGHDQEPSVLQHYRLDEHEWTRLYVGLPSYNHPRFDRSLTTG